MLLAELRHVEGDQRILVTEEEFGERLGELGLTDTGRTGEDERATGALRVLQTGSRTADRLRESLDGVLLADDALVELVLHAQQTGGLLLRQLEDRDAGGRGQDLGDQLAVDLGDDVHVVEPSTPSPAWSSPPAAASPCRGETLPSRSPGSRWPTPCRGGRPRSSRRTRGGPAARSSGGYASGNRPRRSGRSPCPAGSGPRCSGRPASRPGPAPRP